MSRTVFRSAGEQVDGKPAPLPVGQLSYGQYVARQQQLGEPFAGQQASWPQEGAGSAQRLEWPTGHTRVAHPSELPTTAALRLPPELSVALKQLSGLSGQSVDVTVLAAVASWLSRYSESPELVLSAACRSGESAVLSGCVSQRVLLRLDLTGEPTFREMVERVRVGLQEAVLMEVDELEGVQVAVEVGEAMGGEVPSGWRLSESEEERGEAGCDLTVRVEEGAHGLVGGLAYNRAVIDAASLRRMVGHWQQLLEGIVADASRPLATMPLLTPQEYQQMVVEWNATTVAYPQGRCIHEWFEEQVQRTPEAVAVVLEEQEQELSYRELNERANQLAHHLQQRGVGPDVLVGLCMERSLEMVVGLLATVKAGGAYVPLDPDYPPDRLAFMLQDTQMPILLTQQHLCARLPQHDAHVICLDTDWNFLAHEPRENPASGAGPENLIYIIYTSGSTGRPKGVMMQHRAVCNQIFSMIENCQLDSNDRVLQKTSFSFDPSVIEFFTTLLSGARLIMIRPGGDQDSQYLVQTIIKHRVTMMQSIPLMYDMMLTEKDMGNCTSLRYVFCGGEPCPVSLPHRLFALLNVKMYNHYGPTETCITVLSWECQRGGEQQIVPIGHPIANMQSYVLDGHLQPVSIGMPGELYIGGIGLARGYLNRPQLTAERFIAHPFSDEPEARLYKTGDLVRYLSDGTHEFLGRVDQQVKIRGFRIEPGEIEAVLSQHPTVRQAVVVARAATSGDQRLIAYVVLQQAQAVTVEELRRHVMQHMPAYMLPAAFVLLEALPLMPNGKIDRRALPAPAPSERTSRTPYVAPTLPLHHQLVQIWEDLLGIHPIGITDDFFEVGGHSLLAMRLLDRIAQVCGKRVASSTLFAGATIQALTQVLLRETETDSATPLVAVQTGGSRRPFFFLHGQWNGGAFYSLALARLLGAEQPFYLLEPYHLQGLAVPPSFEAIAAAHVQALRQVQAEGPYLLGGWCNGGLMAYEMARQLHAAGQRVDLLVLMDPDPPAPWHWERRLISGLGQLGRVGPERQVAWFRTYRQWRLSFYYWRLQALKSWRSRPGEEARDQQRAGTLPAYEVPRDDWLSRYEWVAAGYLPASYAGQLTLFWTEQEPWRWARWRKVMAGQTPASQIGIHLIPGDHITSRTQYLSVLAEQLGMCLNKVQSHF